uniref:Spermatogenesis associated 17 n=1 Tax=Cynoglossus semilaevis TaxID=244447 RepID=A0A3P8VIP7_CYNSE
METRGRETDRHMTRGREGENRQTENQAAIRIQSWFRACKVQAYLRHLHQNAIIIQRLWRGFTARARFRQMIQQRWRGFYVRKYVHNFYARQRHLQVVSRKNKLIRYRVCFFSKSKQLYITPPTHTHTHPSPSSPLSLIFPVSLSRSLQRPGVFNSPFRQAPHETELLLRQVKYQPPTRGRTGLVAIPDPTTPVSPESPRSSSPWPTLPPIVSRKQQVRGSKTGGAVEPAHTSCLHGFMSSLHDRPRNTGLW